MTHSFSFEVIKQRLALKDLFEADGHELKRSAGKYRCLSPFNSEKTPSCYIDPARERFKCFSSGSSGDVFDYYMLTRGCDIQAAMAALASRAGISSEADYAQPITRPKPVIEEEKCLAPLDDGYLEQWDEGVDFLQKTELAALQIANWRGYSLATVIALAHEEKIACVQLDASLRRQDTEPGIRRVAFPVDGVIDGEVHQVAFHVRLKPRGNDKKASWRFCPSGVGAWPYVLGNVKFAKLLILCEGQWDAIAVFDCLEIPYSALWENKIAIVGLRGAQNWRLFLEHYLLSATTPEKLVDPPKAILPDLTCLVICDGDAAGESWATPNGDDPCLVQILQAICRKVYVREPVEGFGKDVNDILKSLQRPKEENESKTSPDLRT